MTNEHIIRKVLRIISHQENTTHNQKEIQYICYRIAQIRNMDKNESENVYQLKCAYFTRSKE